MWGYHVGALRVVQEERHTGEGATLWELRGQQKDMWMSGQVQLHLKRGDRVSKGPAPPQEG